MRSLPLLLAMVFPLSSAAQALPAVHVKPDQQLTVTGTLTMRPAGRLQFVTVKITTAYLPSFSGSKPTHEIALAGYRDYALLYAHKGQTVTVSGVLHTENASPYYRDGMVLGATEIKAADGTDLKGLDTKPEPVAADVGLYRATASLPADLAAPWRYSVNRRPASKGMLSCSSNGGGDVVNCHCADGFKATQVSKDGKLLDGWAQFGVGNQAKQVLLSVTCSR